MKLRYGSTHKSVKMARELQIEFAIMLRSHPALQENMRLAEEHAILKEGGQQKMQGPLMHNLTSLSTVHCQTALSYRLCSMEIENTICDICSTMRSLSR